MCLPHLALAFLHWLSCCKEELQLYFVRTGHRQSYSGCPCSRILLLTTKIHHLVIYCVFSKKKSDGSHSTGNLFWHELLPHIAAHFSSADAVAGNRGGDGGRGMRKMQNCCVFSHAEAADERAEPTSYAPG